MAIKVYVISDSTAIDFILNDDLEGFNEYLSNEEFLNFGEPELFATESEALAFCSGLGYGVNDRGPIERYPLRSNEETDLPYINSLEAY